MKTAKNKSTPVNDLKQKENLAGVAAKSKKVKKNTKSKNQKATDEAIKPVSLETKETAKILSVADIARIEKKKAKKQAQKLKKQERKTATKTAEQQTKVETKTAVKPKQKNADSPAAVEEKLTSKKKRKLAKKNNDKDADAVKRERTPQDEAATVFVGNLPINTKRVQIVRLFQPYSTVNAIRLRTAGGTQLFKHKQRKGAGSLNAYVVLTSPEVAEKALALNGAEFKGNHLRVTPSAKASLVAADGANDQASSDADIKRTVFVGNLKYSANEQKLREIFSSCGEIDYIRCLQDGEKGCKGVAYVCFLKPDAVGLALELNETVLDDRPIHVERYSVRKLGAKQARDSATASTAGSSSKSKKNSTGAKKRLDKKKIKENEQRSGAQKSTANKKKSEYRGVKVDGIKKNKKPKKKSNNEMSALAKKIAPKNKN